MEYRKNADLGTWYSFLLLVCLLPLTVKYEGLYPLLFFLCLLVSLCTGFSWRNPIYNLKEKKVFLLFMIPVFQILWFLVSSGTLLLTISSCVVVWYYFYFLKTLLASCPKSFTLGEACLLSQGVMLFLISCSVVALSKSKVANVPFMPSSVQESTVCLQILLLGVLLFIHTLHVFPVLRSGKLFVLTCIVAAVLMMLMWKMALDKNILLWMWTFCIRYKSRVILISSWCLSTFVSVVFVVLVNKKKGQKASTITRKFFHLTIMAVYIPGVIYDCELLRLASGIALAVFISLEVCRVLRLPIIGPIIQDAFQIFLDEKDSGVLILTHIYLLIGCSCPIWLFGYVPDRHISLLSGVISVGCGDAAAAVGGSLFGKHRWKGSNKTYEGTFCAITVQTIVCLVFLSLWHSLLDWNLIIVLMAAFWTGILEAKTNQVDNLVLPLLMFSFLAFVK